MNSFITSQPLISFIIPCYNEEKLIAQCLFAIRTEIASLPNYNFEIIVVDNNCTDRTISRVKSFKSWTFTESLIKHKRIAIKIIEETKRGVVAARQAGYKEATGKYIANIDADSFLPNGWIKKGLKYFDQDRNLVAITGPLIYIDLPKWKKLLVKFWYQVGFGCYLLINLFNKGSMLQGGNALIKKEALDKTESIDNFEFYGEDAELARRLSKVGKVKFSLNFPIFSSGRRLKKEGMLKTGIIYGINLLWPILFHRPFTKSWENYR